MWWLGDRMRRDADKAERNARRTRDDEGVGDRGEGQETKGKKAWYYKRALVLKEEVLKRKEGASSSSVGGVAVGDIEEWRFDGAQASAKVATPSPSLGLGGRSGSTTGPWRGVYFSCAGVRVSLTQIMSVGAVWNIAAAPDWPCWKQVLAGLPRRDQGHGRFPCCRTQLHSLAALWAGLLGCWAFHAACMRLRYHD